uniref:Ubiquitin-like domain-containing protein n=1 Tax=Strombidinopsis acuminata TaxID=141414 RepID=A0A7S3RK41_9SPIT|mmetsp:Transcript_112096/g.154765  ORF Transcript_112096/g.154765 Transcript_112096/m.154765 type:complete len:246 (+) Transcript_112096:50-787(+)
MDSLTLHFNIFDASSASSRRSHHVDDPRATTVGALKRQLFLDALEEQRSVRFIASGKILSDADALHSCGLAREAHIQVSISDTAASRAEVAPHAEGGPMCNRTETLADRGDASSGSSQYTIMSEESAIGAARLLGAIVLAGAGVLFELAWRKRWYLSLHASQLICIFAAVWVYLLIFHALPALCKVLCQGIRGQLTSTAAAPAPAQPRPVVTGCPVESLAADFVSSASSSAPAPASAASIATPSM